MAGVRDPRSTLVQPLERRGCPGPDASVAGEAGLVAIAACGDPVNDKFRPPTVNGRADLIVSGDADPLALDPFRGIPIVTPAGCLLDAWR
jgi:hypothetical protein